MTTDTRIEVPVFDCDGHVTESAGSVDFPPTSEVGRRGAAHADRAV